MIPNQSIIYGETAVEPDELTKERHEIIGWYTDESYTYKFDFATAIKKNYKLYANNEKEYYEVAFVSEFEPKLATQLVVAEKVIKPQVPPIDGYEFIGWYSDEARQ